MAKWAEHAHGLLRYQWQSLRMESTSGVNKRCKQTVNSTFGLLSDSVIHPQLSLHCWDGV